MMMLLRRSGSGCSGRVVSQSSSLKVRNIYTLLNMKYKHTLLNGVRKEISQK
jgi:hypothetical protein